MSAVSKTHKAIEARDFSLDAIYLTARPTSSPRRGEILIRVRAVSLNYRDLAVLTGTYMAAAAYGSLHCSSPRRQARVSWQLRQATRSLHA